MGPISSLHLRSMSSPDLTRRAMGPATVWRCLRHLGYTAPIRGYGRLLDPDAPAPYITGTMFRSPPRLDVIWD